MVSMRGVSGGMIPGLDMANGAQARLVGYAFSERVTQRLRRKL